MQETRKIKENSTLKEIDFGVNEFTHTEKFGQLESLDPRICCVGIIDASIGLPLYTIFCNA